MKKMKEAKAKKEEEKVKGAEAKEEKAKKEEEKVKGAEAKETKVKETEAKEAKTKRRERKEIVTLGIVLLLTIGLLCYCMIKASDNSRTAAETDVEKTNTGEKASNTELSMTANGQKNMLHAAGSVETVDALEDMKIIAEKYRDIYEKACLEKNVGELSVTAKIVERLGKEGYSVVDKENEIDMINADSVEKFCKQVTEKKEDSLMILTVSKDGGFWRYDFYTSQGKVHVKSYFLIWKGKTPQANISEEFDAYAWNYTDKGYLMFQEYYPSGYDGESGHTAIRVKPLDTTCREYNRTYIEPVGYYMNNMFITEWGEKDYHNLNFYDMYEVLYALQHGTTIITETEKFGSLYEIPKEQFELVITSFFQIENRDIQENADYNANRETYRYRKRGYYDWCPSNFPKPEVTAYKRKGDILTLTVDGVWEWGNNDEAFTHEVTIHLLPDGTFRYVSNHLINWAENVETDWYEPRLTDEEWEKYYAGYDLPVSKIEKENAEKECREMIVAVTDEMQEKKVQQVTGEAFREKVNRIIFNKITEKGYPVYQTEDYAELQNYGAVDAFLKKASAGEKGETVLYHVRSQMGFSRDKFYFDGTDMYQYATNVVYSERGEIQTNPTVCCRIRSWNYTDKGWFCYEMCEPEPPEVTEVINGNRMVRVLPMKKEYKALAEECLLPVGYQGNNLFCVEWNTEHMEQIDYNGLFEYLYCMKYGERLEEEKYKDGIEKGLFEGVIQSYLNITEAELEQYAVYDSRTRRYGWTKLGCMNYDPSEFGLSIPEITGVKNNKDGSLSVTVEAVCEFTGEENIFSHEVKVRRNENGTITYLGNHILEPGLENIPAYQYRMGTEDK